MNEVDPFKIGEFQSITVGGSAGAADQFRVALAREMSTQLGQTSSVSATQTYDTTNPLNGLRSYAQSMMDSERAAMTSLREMPMRLDAILKGTASQPGPRDLTYVDGKLVATERPVSGERRDSLAVDDPNEVDDSNPTDINALMIKSMREIQERTILMNREERKIIETTSQMNITQNLGFGILRGASGLLTSFLRPS